METAEEDVQIRATIVRVFLVVPLLAAAVALGAPSPASAALPCDPAGIVDEVVRDSVVVPPGASCTMRDAVVRGGVTVGAGGSLFVLRGEIRGSVSGTEVGEIAIVGSVVRGSVTIAGAETQASLQRVDIRGDVSITGGPGDAELIHSTVRGSATLDGHDVIWVEGNSIAVKLSCSNNGSIFGSSGNNTVGGSATGLCSSLA